jgi:hypothetical protein
LSGNDPLAFVIQRNLHRRHLSASQRADVAASIANMRAGDNQHGDRPGTSAAPPVSQKDAAKAMNVSERAVNQAPKVQAMADQ